MIALLALAVAAGAPQPSELKTFKDWIVGCDNGRACQAVALLPEEGNWDGRMTLALRRGPEPEAVPEISFEGDGKVAGIAAGGKRLPIRIIDTEGLPKVHAASIPAMLDAIRTQTTIETLDGVGKKSGTLSLSGSAAALLYMDELQQRLGTVTALIRKGDKPASAVPPPPPLPVVTSVPVPKGAKPLRLTNADVQRLARESGCTDELPDDETPKIELAAIDARTTLVLLGCGAGAYNFMYAPIIARREGNRLRTAPAPLDYDRRSPGQVYPVLVNAGWDPATRRLGAFSKGRGIADCGTGDEYVWDGTRFRLVEQVEMSKCRGSVDYITTWRAAVR